MQRDVRNGEPVAQAPRFAFRVVKERRVDLSTRARIVEVGYAVVSRNGLDGLSIEEVARTSGVGRATIYRYFPGGRDELLAEVVAFEVGRFLGALAEATYGAPDLATMLEDGLVFARNAIREHVLLQRMIAVEPERLLPLLSTESHRVRPVIAAYLLPNLEIEARAGRIRAGVDLEVAADYLARMILSVIATPGTLDVDDPAAVSEFVRTELLGAIAE